MYEHVVPPKHKKRQRGVRAVGAAAKVEGRREFYSKRCRVKLKGIKRDKKEQQTLEKEHRKSINKGAERNKISTDPDKERLVEI